MENNVLNKIVEKIEDYALMHNLLLNVLVSIKRDMPTPKPLISFNDVFLSDIIGELLTEIRKLRGK